MTWWPTDRDVSCDRQIQIDVSLTCLHDGSVRSISLLDRGAAALPRSHAGSDTPNTREPGSRASIVSVVDLGGALGAVAKVENPTSDRRRSASYGRQYLHSFIAKLQVGLTAPCREQRARPMGSRVRMTTRRSLSSPPSQPNIPHDAGNQRAAARRRLRLA
jgi:hypothetical protein